MNKIKLNTINTKAPQKANKKTYEVKLEELRKEMSSLQHKLYASSEYSFLIIFQGIDTSGKDSTIRHVFSGVDPLGVHANAFKVPNELELKHDFMWRISQKLPERGRIQIFNRSYYEDILIPTIKKTLPENKIEKRYDFINAFEDHLLNNKTLVMKFYLHISASEQKKRIKERMEDPSKKWKYSEEDMKSSKKRSSYEKIYEKIFSKCGPQIPWIIVPSDDKWYRNYIVASAIVKRLKQLNLKYPEAKKL